LGTDCCCQRCWQNRYTAASRPSEVLSGLFQRHTHRHFLVWVIEETYSWNSAPRQAVYVAHIDHLGIKEIIGQSRNLFAVRSNHAPRLSREDFVFVFPQINPVKADAIDQAVARNLCVEGGITDTANKIALIVSEDVHILQSCVYAKSNT